MEQSSLFLRHHALVGRAVRVLLRGGSTASGLLYAIDPESDAVALLRPDDSQEAQDADANGFRVHILLAHAVDELEADEKAHGGLKTLAELRASLSVEQEPPERQTQRQEETRRRGERLERFLAQRFVPFKRTADGGVQVFGGAATVPPPFRAVRCGNEQLLRRLQTLLADFEAQEQAQQQERTHMQQQAERELQGAGGIGP